VAEWNLHPTVVAENPKRRKHGSQRNQAAGQEIKPERRPVAAEQHDTQEHHVKQEGGKGLLS
jgi:hypothetical protein